MTHQERAQDAEARGDWREAADCWHALLMNTPRGTFGRGTLIGLWVRAKANAEGASVQ